MAALVVIALASVGCSGGQENAAGLSGPITLPAADGAPSTPAGPGEGQAGTAPGSSGSPAPGTSGAVSSSSTSPANGGTTGGGAPPTTTPPRDLARGGTPGYPLEVTGPSCVKQGEEFRAQITTRPDADLGIIFGFSDDDTHGTMRIAQANEHGAYTVVLLITPKMPPGPAELLVSSGIGGEGAAMEYQFEIVRAGGKCR